MTGDLIVTADPGFSVDTTDSSGLALTATDGDLSFVDDVSGSVVRGSWRGINARHYGAGALEISADGAVTATRGDSAGIFAEITGSDNASALTITTGADSSVTGGREGLDVRHSGIGELGISVDGAVTGTARDGISARSSNTGNAEALIIATGGDSDVTGERDGIRARHDGTGAVRVDVGGSVAGAIGDGVFATAADGLLTVTAAEGSRISGRLGIYAEHTGSGALTVTADNNSAVSGAGGIRAVHRGTGALGVGIAGAEVEGANFGIAALILNEASNEAVTVTAGAGSSVMGLGVYATGIYARQDGAGALIVSADGHVEGGAFLGSGIIARTNLDDGAGVLSVTTGSESRVVSEYRDGIYARQAGLGALDVVVDGEVDAGDVGVDARITNSASDAALTITTGDLSHISAGRVGIDARQGGTGELDITASGTVTAETYSGIYAIIDNDANDSALTVTASGTITGGSGDPDAYSAGIYARRNGSGAIDITTSDDSAVTGSQAGIVALHEGSGNVTVAANGTVSGAEYLGIGAAIGDSFQDNLDPGLPPPLEGAPLQQEIDDPVPIGDIEITTGSDSDVYGGVFGIGASHSGHGSITITADGTIEGGFAGIGAGAVDADNADTIQITTLAGSDVSGAGAGIYAIHDGPGALQIEARGDVRGTGYDGGDYYAPFGYGFGIAALTGEGRLEITTAAGSNVSGRSVGIQAVSYGAYGTGDSTIDITVAGTVTGEDFVGIQAAMYNPYGAGDLTIAALAGSEINGAYAGMFAALAGSGDLTITTDADSDVNGGVAGIGAIRSGEGDLTITAQGRVRGASPFTSDDVAYGAGIFAASEFPGVYENEGASGSSVSSGDMTVITTAGSEVSGALHGIYMRSDSTGALSVTAGGEVTGGNSAAIFTDAIAASSHEITIEETGTLSAASEHAIDASGTGVTITNLGTINGFVTLTDQNDVMTNRGTWNTAGLASDFGAGNDDRFVNLATLMAADDADDAQFTRLDNLETFVNQGGVIVLGDGFAGDVLEISGDFVAEGGVITMDAVLGDDHSDADRFVIGGDARREGAATGIFVNALNGGGAVTNTGIMLVEVEGTSDDDVFTLTNSVPLEMGAFVYDLNFGTCDGEANDNWYLCSTGDVGTMATVFEAGPSVLLSAFATLPSMQQRLGQRQWLPRGGEVPVASRGLTAAAGQSVQGGMWMRLHGEQADIAPRDSDAAATHRRTSWGLQLGADMLAAEGAGGDWVLGAHAGFGTVSADVSNGVGTGQISGQGWSLGASATWLGVNGSYVDLQGEASWLQASFATEAHGTLVEDRPMRALALSAEFGHRFALNGNAALVPQAQLSFGQISGGTFTDAQGSEIVLGDHSQSVARLGLAYEFHPGGAGGEGQLVYGIVNVLHELSGPGAVSVAGTPLQLQGEPTWGEIGLGGSIEVAPGALLYGEASYRTALGAGSAGNQAFAASAGLRFRW